MLAAMELVLCVLWLLVV
uniref:Uncharacterized protein n=1 Tax=Arundo donax TaxID=35708 RepID=A0A0A9CCZ6_ARUDO